MGFWRRLFGGSGADEINPQRLDYLNEALALERQGDYDSALTSYRLALRDHPNDARILQNMAIAFTKTRRIDEAIRHYRRALELDRELAGAHYGLAFLLLDGHGDSVAATVVWATADTAPILTVLDSLTGWTLVNRTGQTGRLVARSDRLVSNPLSIRTLAAADTLFTTLVSTVDTVTLSADSVSDSLTVEVADTIKSSSGGDSLTVALAGRPVVYAITYPATSGPVTLVTNDSTHGLVTTDTVATGASGIAFVQVRLLGAPVPDSVVVAAIARRAVGDTVPGSPVTFVVRFRP